MSPWALICGWDPHMAAWATLSQADNLPSRENMLYTMGVSANF